jgi:hypothetical protein
MIASRDTPDRLIDGLLEAQWLLARSPSRNLSEDAENSDLSE